MTPPPAPPIGLADLEGVRRLAGVLLRGEADADDLAMDAVVVALERPPRAGYAPAAWLRGIARRLAANRRRAAAVRRRHEAEAARPEAAPDDADVAAHLRRRRLVLDALAALPEDAAQVLCLRYFDDLPPRAIAARLGVPVETVRTRTKRALARLRDELDRRHAGDRAAWGALLAPLAPVARVAPVGAVAAPGDAAAGDGPAPADAPAAPLPTAVLETVAVASTVKPALAVVAAAVLVTGGLLVLRGRAGGDGPAPVGPAVADALPDAGTPLAAASPAAAAPTATPPTAAGGVADRGGPGPGVADGGVADGARVTGRVVDAAGTPWAGAQVRLVPDDALLVYLGVSPEGRWSSLEAVTGADGAFGFEGVRPRDGYALLFEAPGKAITVRGDVAFVAGERARLGDVVLLDGATVRGVVRGADGAPVAGARVGLALRPPNPLQFVLARVDRLPWREAVATTDAAGRFEAAHVAEGKAVLVVEAAGRASAVRALTVPPSGVWDAPEVVLAAADDVRGVAVLADGTPAAGARVLVTRDGGLAGYDGVAGADGAFTVAAVPPGAGPVHGYLPGLAPVVSPPAPTGAADVRLRFGASGRLEGRVVGPDGEPVPRFRLAVRAAEGGARDLLADFVEDVLVRTLGPVEVVADDGRFAVGPLEARDVVVEVRAAGFVPATTAPVTVPAGAVSARVEVRLRREASVRGRVVDAEGHAVADASVCVQRGATIWARPRRASPSGGLGLLDLDAPVVEARTGPDGAFEVTPDAPGPVALTVRAPGLAVHFRAGLDPAVAREPLVVTLTRGAAVAGRVGVTGPGPAGPMQVVAHVPEGQVVAAVGADGAYRLEGLPPGGWLVVPLPLRAVLHPDAGDRREELVAGLGARWVTVADGATLEADLVVPPLPWLEVRLSDLGPGGTVDELTFRRDDLPPGPAADGATRDPAWSPITWPADARPDGTWVVRGLLPGTYTGELWVTQVVAGAAQRSVVQSQALVRAVVVPTEARAVALPVALAPR